VKEVRVSTRVVVYSVISSKTLEYEIKVLSNVEYVVLGEMMMSVYGTVVVEVATTTLMGGVEVEVEVTGAPNKSVHAANCSAGFWSIWPITCCRHWLSVQSGS